MQNFQLIKKVLPNFFPHIYNVYREDDSTVGNLKEPFKAAIFKHLKENELGSGSHETIVYKGKYGQRSIAIKKVLKTYSATVEREISTMMKTDRHPNILRFYGKEVDENFLYIGTELCECNLAEFIKDKDWRMKLEAVQIYEQSLKGLNYLHELKISNK